MAIHLTDDGTLDTVLRCSNCGEEFRFNFVNAFAGSTFEPTPFYEDWIEDMIRETTEEHNCETSPEEERKFNGRE